MYMQIPTCNKRAVHKCKGLSVPLKNSIINLCGVPHCGKLVTGTKWTLVLQQNGNLPMCSSQTNWNIILILLFLKIFLCLSGIWCEIVLNRCGICLLLDGLAHLYGIALL